MTPSLRRLLFETLYKNRYLYRFASTVPFGGQWRVWQRQVLSRLHGPNVLELGCGLGDLLADMLEVGYSCRAIEHAPQMVAAARATLRKRHLGQDATVIQGSAQSLPFSDATFNTVVSTFPSEYIYDPDTISEVARVLRPNGRLIVIEGANLLPVGLLPSILILLQMFVYGSAAVLGPRHRGDIHDALVPHRVPTPTQKTDSPDITVDVLNNAWFGRNIPLEQFNLRRRSERIRSPRWEVYMTIGEKT